MLTVLEESSRRDKSRVKYYKCECDCGKIKIISRMALVTKDTKSCGCFNIISKQLEVGQASWNALFYNCKRSAKSRGIVFKINRNSHKIIASKNCYYCGTNPIPWSRYVDSSGKNIKNVTESTLERSFILANGIDRLDNNKGYILNNCVPCCVDCNEMKMDRKEKYFLSHIRKIIHFQDNKK